MFASLIAIVAAASGLPGTGWHAEGRCNYPATLGEPAPGERRTFCNSVSIDGPAITFERDGRGAVIAFRGEWDGDRMDVRQVDPPAGNPLSARGECAIYRKGGRVSAVSCVASQGARTWVANFLPDGV